MPTWAMLLILVGGGVGSFVLVMAYAFAMMKLGERLRQCPACGARGLRCESWIKSTRPPGGEFSLYHCASCDTWFKQERPTLSRSLAAIDGDELARAKELSGLNRR